MKALGMRMRRAAVVLTAVGGASVLATLTACGGGNPFGNPPPVSNPPGNGGGQSLSFAYFQKCIDPIFLAQLQITQNGHTSTNTCSGAGCHDSNTGTGGALRVVVAAKPVDLTDPANTPDVIRTTDMYKNFYSAQGVTVPGDATRSLLFEKPQLLGVLHGGGLIFSSPDDPNLKLITYWIDHPAPAGQDEFSPATYSMFTPADPESGTCNTQ